MRRLNAGSVSGHRAADETAKCPESLGPMSVVPSSGRRVSPPQRALPLRLRYCGLMRQSPLTLPSFGLSLVRGVSAGCYQPRLPAGSSRRYFCESFLGCLVPCHGRSHRVHLPVSSPMSSAFPNRGVGRLPALPANTVFPRSVFRGCRHFFTFKPPSLLISQTVPTAAHTATGQLRLLRPGIACFVASTRTGYANRPKTGNWRCEDSHPARFAALSAAPPCLRFAVRLATPSAKLGAEWIATPFS